MSRFRLKSPQLTENDIKRACLDLARYRHYYPVRLQSGLFYTVDGRPYPAGEPGIPDFVLVHGDYPAPFVEFKRPGRKLDPRQQDKFAELILGYDLHAVRADDPVAFRDWLDEFEARCRVRMAEMCK